MEEAFNNLTATCDIYGLPHCTKIPLYAKVIPLLVALVIMLSNSIIMIVIAISKSLRDNSCYYVFSLATADFLVGLFSSIQSRYTLMDIWPSRLESSVIGMAVTSCASLSITTLAVMSVDRFMAIKHALTYEQTWTFARCIASIVGLWVGNITLEGVGCLVLGKVSYSRFAYANFIDSEESRWFLLFYIALIYHPSVGIILYSYLNIFAITRRHLRNMAATTTSTVTQVSSTTRTSGNTTTTSTTRDDNQHFRRLVKAARTIFIAVCFFLVSWSPYFALQIVPIVTGFRVRLSPVGEYVLPWGAVCNSFMNPFIYSITNRTYREAIVVLINRLTRGRFSLWRASRSATVHIHVKPALTGSLPTNY